MSASDAPTELPKHQTNPRQEEDASNRLHEDEGARAEQRQRAESAGAEGRDGPPPNPRPGGARDESDPWLGGG